MGKRILALLLAGIMLLALASCNNNKEPGGEETSKQETVDNGLNDGLPAVDMDGFELSILHDSGAYIGTWSEVRLDAEGYTGDVVSDAMYTRNRSVEDRFNCSIKVSGSDCVLAEDVNRYAMSNLAPYDVIYIIRWGAFKAVDSIIDLNEIPYLSLDQEWWHPESQSISYAGGKQFSAVGSFSLSAASVARGFLFNNDLYHTIEPEKSMYDYVYNDEWTWENFYRLCEEVAHPASTGIEAVYGVGETAVKPMYYALINGAGLKFVETDADGKLQFTLADNPNLFVDTLMEFAKIGKGMTYSINNPVDMETETSDGKLTQNTALFKVSAIYGLSKASLKDSGISFGFMPNPKYNSSQTEYHSGLGDYETMVVLKTVNHSRYENIGIIMEALSFNSHYTILKTYLEEIVTFRNSPDLDCMHVMLLIQDSLFFDTGATLLVNQYNDLLYSMFVESGGGQIRHAIDTHKGTVQKRIDEINDSY